MANCILGAPNFADSGLLYTPTLSGGSWETALPLTNLSDRRLHRVARSTDAAVASTVFTVDLGTDRAVRVLAIPRHTISEAGTVRVRGFLGSGSTVGVPVLDALDFSTGWSGANPPTRTAAAFVCADGVPLDLLNDDNAAGLEQYNRVVPWTNSGNLTLSFRVKAGTSTSGVISVQDTTAAATRMRCIITFSAGVPSLGMGVGSLVSSTAIEDGTGEYRVVVACVGIVGANTNQLNVSPATDAAADITDTGTMYLGDFMAWNSSIDRLVYDTGYESALPANTDAEDREGVNVPWVHVTDEDKTARIWRVNINDTTNADGYVDLSRLVIAGGVQPSFNMNYGARLGYEDDTVRTLTDGGAAVYDEREKRRRTVTFRVDGLPEAEAYSGFGGLSRRGIARQVMFVYDPDDTTLKWQRSFLATLREPSEFESAILARAHTTVTLLEEL